MLRVKARFIKHVRVGIFTKSHTLYIRDWLDFSEEEKSEGNIFNFYKRETSLVCHLLSILTQKLSFFTRKDSFLV